MRTHRNLSGMNFILLFLLVLSFIILLSGCARPFDMEECMPDKVFGFWSGLLHGFIAPFTFIISLFKDDVVMYACNNSGGWYDFGFVLGAGIIFGGGGKASSKK